VIGRLKGDVIGRLKGDMRVSAILRLEGLDKFLNKLFLSI